jgi:hypothetical protein
VSALATSTSTAYRAQARRIRARLAHRPLAMHRALANLNARVHPPPVERPAVRPAAGGVLPDTARCFQQIVIDQLHGPLMRYSQRLALLRQAQRLGIGRFHANLIIATVQHRLRHIAEPADSPPPRAWMYGRLAVAAALQAAILAAVWSLGWK